MKGAAPNLPASPSQSGAEQKRERRDVVEKEQFRPAPRQIHQNQRDREDEDSAASHQDDKRDALVAMGFAGADAYHV